MGRKLNRSPQHLAVAEEANITQVHIGKKMLLMHTREFCSAELC